MTDDRAPSLRAESHFAFEKWEGIGNDFLVVETASISPDLARVLCDRRLGVGADGVLVVGADPAGPSMTVFNADGSRPEMCGNGLRCVAAYLVTSGRGAMGRPMVVATDAGPRRCVVEASAGTERFDVEVDMGIARLDRDLEIDESGRRHRFSVVDVGNPHAVTFAAYEQAEAERLAPRVATLPAAGINVEFAREKSSAAGEPIIDVFVWERGVGPTRACGTGACAVAALACETGRAAFDRPVRVALPGGVLEVTVRSGSRALTMRGAARRVFRGEVGPS